ncbi:hypothetical protein TELCIR_12539, partial [Teladorsagia circumcincta]
CPSRREKGQAKESRVKRTEKEECRRKDQEINRLEKKIEDKDVVMADCLRELKEQHKTRVTELEERIADMKRRIMKLESENNVQKLKLETSMERESSVDSDYGRSSSGRLSNSGRQYSLMSLNSFTSVRTLNNRRMTDSDMSSSLYSPRRRGDSQYDVSSCGLTRAPSTSSIIEKDRRISDLERQLSQLSRSLLQNESCLASFESSLKRAAEKIAACQHENALRTARRGTDDQERERLRDELARVQVELDRAVTTIRQLEGSVQTQGKKAMNDLEKPFTLNEFLPIQWLVKKGYALLKILHTVSTELVCSNFYSQFAEQDETNSALNTIENKLEKMDLKEH